MVLRPYDRAPTWRQKGMKYKPGTQKYQDYLDTIDAKRFNSFKVPALACYVIWCCFALVVLLAALRRLLPKSKRVALLDRYLTQAPLVSRRHQQPYRILGLNWHAPLRGHAIVLFGLFLANLLPMVVDYRILDPARNVNWPDNGPAQVARYVADRAATMATLQIPLLVMLSARSGPVALLTGARFHTLMIYHKYFAVLFGVLVVVHGVSMLTFASLYGEGQLKKYGASVYARMGMASAVLVLLQVTFSTRPLRARAYETFVALHVLVAVAVLVGVWYHITLLKSATLGDFSNGILVACAFWGFDVLARLVRLAYFNTLFALRRGQVETVLRGTDDAEQVLKVTVQVNAKRSRGFLRPGRHIYLHVPGVQPLAAHPFSVADWTQGAKDGSTTLTLFARVRKGLTKRLAAHASSSQRRDPVMLVEGFYGIDDDEISSIDSLLLAAGGIGITHCLSYLVDRLRQDKRVHLVWTMREPSLAAIALDILERAASQADASSKALCSLSLHVTGHYGGLSKRDSSSSATHHQDIDEKALSIDDEKMMPGIRSRYEALGLASVAWYDARPDVAVVMDGAVSYGAVVSCGGPAFCDDVRAEANKRGAALYEEPFGW